MDFPVYEKDGMTQIAGTPQREVELQFDGWRKREDKPAPPPPTEPKPPKPATK